MTLRWPATVGAAVLFLLVGFFAWEATQQAGSPTSAAKDAVRTTRIRVATGSTKPPAASASSVQAVAAAIAAVAVASAPQASSLAATLDCCSINKSNPCRDRPAHCTGERAVHTVERGSPSSSDISPSSDPAPSAEMGTASAGWPRSTVSTETSPDNTSSM